MVLGTSVPTSFARGSFTPVKEAQWVPDKERDRCKLCSKSFGLLRRKHHCRGDGEIFCEDCSAFKLVAKDAAGSHEVVTVRVCKICFEKHAAPEGEALHNVPVTSPLQSRSRASTERPHSSSTAAAASALAAAAPKTPIAERTLPSAASPLPSASPPPVSASPPPVTPAGPSSPRRAVWLVGRHAMSAAHTLSLLWLLLCVAKLTPWSSLALVVPLLLALAFAVRHVTRPPPGTVFVNNRKRL